MTTDPHPAGSEGGARTSAGGLESGPMAERKAPPGGDTTVLDPKTRTEKETKRPPLYRVLFHNDDYTTQEFVVWLLKTVFRKPEAEATVIMLAVHKAGVGVAGIYTRDVAETRAARGRQLAERDGFPLLLTVEENDA